MASSITTHAREQVRELPPKNLPCADVKHCAQLAVKCSNCQVHVTPIWNIVGLCRGWRMASSITTHAREQVRELPPKNLPCADVKHCAQLNVKCSKLPGFTSRLLGTSLDFAGAGGRQVTSPTHAREQVCEPATQKLALRGWQTLCAACHKTQYLSGHVTPTWNIVGLCTGWRMASYITTHAREQVCELPPKNLPCAVANIVRSLP